jgi:hypothetical protein
LWIQGETNRGSNEKEDKVGHIYRDELEMKRCLSVLACGRENEAGQPDERKGRTSCIRKDTPRDREKDESVYSGRASSRMERGRVTPGEQDWQLKTHGNAWNS